MTRRRRRSNPFKLPEAIRAFARRCAHELVYVAGLKRLPLAARPTWLDLPGYSRRKVKVYAIASGYAGETGSWLGKASGSTIFLKITPEFRKLPKAQQVEQIESILLHEIVHVFDPKVRDPKLKHLLTGTTATSAGYYADPAELDAYMTQRIYYYLKALDDVAPADLPAARRELLDHARIEAELLATSGALSQSDMAAWAALGPDTWRRYIKALVRAIETYQPMPRRSPRW